MINSVNYLDLAPLTTDMEQLSEDQFTVLTDRADQLSSNIREILASKKTAELLLDIERKHTLKREQTQAISKTLREVLMGDIPARELRNRVRKTLLTSPESADQIVTLLTKELITPVYFELKNTPPSTVVSKQQTATKISPPPPTINTNNNNNQKKNTSNLVDLRKKTDNKSNEESNKPSLPPLPRPPRPKEGGSHGPLPSK